MGKRQPPLGTIVFFVLAPGVVAGLIPWWLSRWEWARPLPFWLVLRVLGGALIAGGAIALVHAFVAFVVEGAGTPAPVAPTRHLVVDGLYRYVRNPMYIAVVSIVVGQALLLGRPVLLLSYALLIAAVMAAFARWYEEPALQQRFGIEYDAYRRAVPAWKPRRTPWERRRVTASVADAAVIGAGSSGLAVLKALREQGLAAECFERGSEVGGLWRYENETGSSGAYASLRTNVSRSRMQYASFPMPDSYGEFPHHSEMAAYLGAYADAFGLRSLIRFGNTVARLEPAANGTWRVALDDGSWRSFRAAVIATGPFWCPRLPTYPGGFAGQVTHSHNYRISAPFADRRVLVVGAGQSAAEIAVEISKVAERTLMSIRSGVHVIPRWIGRRPYDAADVDPVTRLPWGLINLIYGWRVGRALGPLPPSWPRAPNRLLEGIPIVSSDLLPAVRCRDVVVRPAIERLSGDLVRFADGSEERVDDIVYATGYRISLPFLSSSLVSAHGRGFPLYRRIAAAEVRGLYFAGFVDAPGGLLPLVEAQGEWIAAVLAGRLRLPRRQEMWRAMERAERRTRQRFPNESAYSIRSDPHAYRRLLQSDLRRARTVCARPRNRVEGTRVTA